MDTKNAHMAVAIACIACSALTAVPYALTSRAQHAKGSLARQHQEAYEDKDGSTTGESEALFTNATPCRVMQVASVVGAAAGLASSIVGVSGPAGLLWAVFAIWLLMIGQSVILAIASKSTIQYTLGKWSSLAGFLMAVSTALRYLSGYNRTSSPNFTIWLCLVQLVSALTVCLTGVLLSRRPDVFHEGHVVDRKNTTSFLGKCTFAWAFPMLDHAARNQNLEIEELPIVSHDWRAGVLCSLFENEGNTSKLWWHLFLLHKTTFVALCAVQILASFMAFVPELLLYLILRLLEQRDDGAQNQFTLWIVALALGIVIACKDWLGSYVWFLSTMKLKIQINVQLASGVLSKSLRAKNAIYIPEAEDEGDEQSKASDTESNDGEDDSKRTKQSVINLISIDSQRVAELASAADLFLESFIEVIIAVVFLVNLIGWIPLLSGLSVPLILSPLNLYISRRYMHAENQLMGLRDQKMATVNEALQGIRQIKFSALETVWYTKILEVRAKELARQWKVFVLDTWLNSVWELGPLFLSAVSLTVYALRTGGLSASIAFTSISIFETLEGCLSLVPGLLSELMDCIISVKRLEDYFKSPEQQSNKGAGQKIVIDKATVAWPSDERAEGEFKLRNITLDFAMGELNVISGKTGSGKSLLLAAIIGEADILSGTVVVPKSPLAAAERLDVSAPMDGWIVQETVAYVNQAPWIENATFKENILFQLPYDAERYNATIEACALKPDLELLTDGDETEIGANGVNLSGGQKWRVSFARALYSRAGILVMDDIFSAVDAHVGRHLYEKALIGNLSHGRTRILVTHHTELCLPSTQYSIVLENGRVLRTGQIEHGEPAAAQSHEQEVVEDLPPAQPQRRLRRSSTRSDRAKRLTRQESRVSEPSQTRRKFVSKESREVGRVRFAVYKEFIQACRGFGYWTMIAALFFSYALTTLARSYWVTVWTRQSENHPENWVEMSLTDGLLGDDQISYAAIYGGISLFVCILGTARYFAIYLGSIQGSKVLFERMTSRVLRTPLRFLDITPVGRLNNRFSSDFADIDSSIASELGFMLDDCISIMSIILAALFVSPFMAVFVALFILVVWLFASKYIRAAREVHRLESTTRSPILEQFGSVLTGIATIRAFDKADLYIDRMHRLIDKNVVASWHLALFNRWLDLRLNMVGAAFTCATAALIVGIPSIDASLAGFALSFSLQLSNGIIWFIRRYAEVELSFNAVERVVEYTQLDTEPQEGRSAPAAWPAKGEVVISDLSVAYADDLPPILHDLSFSVRPHERIGVVGRTGAGKSSLMLALFRFLEPRSGSIHIDGIDISEIKLDDLRSRLVIIPQSPILFSGTVRSNLDPAFEHTDLELHDALFRVRLTPSVGEPASEGSPSDETPAIAPEGSATLLSLSTPVAEGGSNFSQGQRQLLCLARAIVASPKIMILDEATSAVDMDTDALIQRSIRTEFENSTLLVIAHRLSTVADFDRLLVLGDGKVLEFGTPKELMQKQSRVGFWGMVMDSGERAVLEKVIYQS